MKVTIERSEIDGRIEAPSSKSMTHRAVICSALAQGESQVNRPLVSDDTDATLRVVHAIGAGVEKSKGSWIIEGGELNPPEEDLHCGDSGTTLRLMTAVCAIFRGTSVLKGGPSLSGRPVEPLLDALRQLGVQCESNDGYPPVKVHGRGGIDGGEVLIRGDISSQFVSALLLVAPYARKQLRVKVTTRLESAPYVGMTMDAQRAFGVQVEVSEGYREMLVEKQRYTPTEYAVEGDWSSGAYMLAAGALAGKVSMENLIQDSRQADTAIVGVLGEMGAKLRFLGERVGVDFAEISGIDWDLTDSPLLSREWGEQATGAQTLKDKGVRPDSVDGGGTESDGDKDRALRGLHHNPRGGARRRHHRPPRRPQDRDGLRGPGARSKRRDKDL
jgi:3-phosphoshikimate 1-carboxyvinyltransferase